MVMNRGNMVAATAVWAMRWVRSTVTMKQPSMIMPVRSPTITSIL